MGASLLILIIAFLLVRWRKARKASGTAGADIIVTGPLAAGAAKKEKAKSKDAESSSSSIHSEPLPLHEMNETQRAT
jgi:hypothetical protein